MRGEGGGAEGLFVCKACTPSLIVLRKLLKASSVSLRNLCCNGEASNATDEKKERGRRRSLRGWGGKLLSRFSKAIYLLAFSCRDSFRFDSSTLDNSRDLEIVFKERIFLLTMCLNVAFFEQLP